MGNLREYIYTKSPHSIQNLIVSTYNILAYRKRYSGKYNEYVKHYHKNKFLKLDQLQKIQAKKYKDFINYVAKNSVFYSKVLNQIELPENINNIQKLPIIDKETLRSNIEDIYTIPKHTGVISKTGGYYR